MESIRDYELVLFDFDGLLVDTEFLHYQAYLKMCAQRGVKLNWDFNYFCKVAHESADGLRLAIFPQFAMMHISWEELYLEKQKKLKELIKTEPLLLMPGASALIKKLLECKIPMCVVTHSPKEFIDIIRDKIAELKKITYWIVREDYQFAKPNPECYQLAIDRYGQNAGKIIGFEDSYRGFSALDKTRAHPVLICSKSHPQMQKIAEQKIDYFETLSEVQ